MDQDPVREHVADPARGARIIGSRCTSASFVNPPATDSMTYRTLGRMLVAGLGALGVLLAGCAAGGDAGANRVERVDSAGIAVVRNIGPDRPLRWAVHEVLRLGGADEGPEAFFNVYPQSVQVDARGHLIVLDAGNHQVHEFDREGRHVRTLGREGGGPGEMELPSMLSLGPDGIVGVYDYTKRGVLRFAADGSPLETMRVNRPPRYGAVLAGSGLLGVYSEFTMGADYETVRLVYTEGADSVEIAALQVGDMKPVDFGCVSISGMSPLLQPDLVYAVAGDRVLINAGAEYVVRAHGLDGRVHTVITRDLPPVPATAELARLEVGDSMRIRIGTEVCSVPAEKVVEARGYASVVPAVRGIVAAPDGGFWVRRGVGRDNPTIDVFAADGEYLGTLPEGTPFPAAFRGPDEIVTVERDELDLPYVVVYRIERG